MIVNNREVDSNYSRKNHTHHTQVTNTEEPRFNKVIGDWPNLFVKSRVHYNKNLDITNLRGNDQNVH